MGPGIEPASSWILVEFITAEPQGELLLFIYLFIFLGPHLQHMKVLRLGDVEVELELQLLACATATAA